MGDYLKCPKCNSVKVEIFEGETKTKISLWGCLVDKNTPRRKLVREIKKHCKECGYVW